MIAIAVTSALYMRFGMSLVSMALVLGLYALIGMHFYAYIVILCPLLRSRLGEQMGMLWVTVGLCLLYNILFNHFWAMVIKPGGPKDQRMIERLRHEQKQRANRKSVSDSLASKDNDRRFEGLTSDVKKLLRYRDKTME